MYPSRGSIAYFYTLMLYLHTTPNWLRALFPPGLQWRGPVAGPQLYLTFDDGPHPDITPWVLEQLATAGAKATFFCIGDNVHKYPAVLDSIRRAGHSVGNHTYHHLNGWQTPAPAYLDNIDRADALLGSRLFRPPYGRISRAQAHALRQQGYRVVMWTGLTGDFDPKLQPAQCAAAAVRLCRPASLLVLHDSEKAWPRLQVALPALLRHMQATGLTSAGLEEA